MRAFVLSGGGNRGPLEVGALQVLIEHGIIPAMIAGSSAGALNGALLAVNPCSEQVQRMADLWRESGRKRVVRFSPVRTLWQLLRGRNHLMDTRQMRQFVSNCLLPDKRCFGDLAVPLYVTIAHVVTRTLYVYGDDPTAPIVDAVMTSAAVPGAFPPTLNNGEVFVDGGVISNLPVRLAVARGATEIWAIDLARSLDMPREAGDAFKILGLSIIPAIYDGVLRELEYAIQTPGVVVHHIPIYAYQDVALGDFSRTEAMLLEGARVMREYLANPQPNVIHYPPRWKEAQLPPGPPGARPFV
jgi:NTE family protein